MNKMQGGQIQFSLEKKTLEKEKWIHHLSTIKITPVDGLYYKKIDSSMSWGFFNLSQNVYHAMEKKQ